MEQYVKALSDRYEFLIVVLLAFGFFMFGSIVSVLYPDPGASITESDLHFLILYELVVIIILGKFLSIRGWKVQHLGLAPTVKDSIIGVGLVIVAYIAAAFVWYIAFTFVWFVSSSSAHGMVEQARSLVAPNLRLITILVVSVLNPIFEEVFVCGYIIAALRKTRSVSFAINVSVGIRLTYHLYQGAIGVITLIPPSFIYSYWFVRTGRLWPLVIAHGIIDFWGLVAYVRL